MRKMYRPILTLPHYPTTLKTYVPTIISKLPILDSVNFSSQGFKYMLFSVFLKSLGEIMEELKTLQKNCKESWNSVSVILKNFKKRTSELTKGFLTIFLGKFLHEAKVWFCD